MKTERRHELQTNDLAVWLTDALETAKPYARLGLGIVLAACVLTAFYVVMSRRTKAGEQRGWTSYFQAIGSQENDQLEQVARDYPGTSVAYWSHVVLGDRHYSRGVELRFHDRTEDEKALRDAVENYRAARASGDPLLRQRAGLGLARSLEALQEDMDQARDEYQALANQWPDSPYGKLAQQRLTDLERQSTKEFYDWFAVQDPKPALEGQGLEPGTRPILDEGHESVDFSLTPDNGEPGSPDAGTPEEGPGPSGESTPGPETEGEPPTTSEPAADGEADDAGADGAEGGEPEATEGGESEDADAESDDAGGP